MRARRALLAVAAACLAALCVLAVTAHTGRSATSNPVARAVSLTPNCADVTSAGTQVHATAANMAPGATYTVRVYDLGPNYDQTADLGTGTVAADGTVDTTFAVPGAGDARLIRVGLISRVSALGFFAWPCPTVTVSPTCGPADDGNGGGYALTVRGTGWYPKNGLNPAIKFAVHIGGALGGDFPGSPVTPNPDGTFSTLVTPAKQKAGSFPIYAYTSTADLPDYFSFKAYPLTASTPFTVPCPQTQTTPTTQTTATTAPTTTAATTAPVTTNQASTATPTTSATTAATRTTGTTTTTKTATTPAGALTLAVAPACLPIAGGTARVQVTGGGFGAGAVDVLVDGTVATKASAGGDGKVTAEVEVTPGKSDHTIEIREGSRQVDATLRVPCTTHPHLDVDPVLGPPGSVQTVTGTGFPPNTLVMLRWRPGLGRWSVRSNGKGGFTTHVLILPQDQLGDRALRATPRQARAFAKVQAAFLAVPGSVQTPRTYEFRR